MSSYTYRANEKGTRQRWRSDERLTPHVGLMATPNANGELHPGHAYVSLSEDVWARLNQLRGRKSRIVTGADHGGHSLVMVARQEYVSAQLNLLEKCSRIFDLYKPMIFATLDALRTQFVLEEERTSIDDKHRQKIAQVFVDLVKRSYIARACIPTNWCPHCRMIVPYVEARPSFTRAYRYTLKLHDERGEEVCLQTEEPEMFTTVPFAVVSRSITARRLQHPLRPAEWLPVVQEAEVSRLQAGFLYWPESNLEAYQMAKRKGWDKAVSGLHSLEDRLSARSKVLKEMQHADISIQKEMENVRIYRCHCHTKLEVLPLEQWVLDLAKVQVDLNIRFSMENVVPHSAQSDWSDKIENYVGDWTLSRQSVWGIHPPAYQCTRCQAWHVALQEPETCSQCQGPVVQDSDVIDVWFVSNIGKITWGQDERRAQCEHLLSSISLGSDTFGLACIRTEILARLLMGKSLAERIAVLPILVDEWGRKLSKSQGNARSVNAYLEEWGADVLRLSLLRASVLKGKVRFGEYLFIQSRNLLQKLLSLKNFFVLSTAQTLGEGPMDGTDQALWLSLLHETSQAQEFIYRAIEQVNFSGAIQKIEEVTRKIFSKVICVYLRMKRENGTLSRLVLHSFCQVYLQWVSYIWAFTPDIALNIFEELGEEFETFTFQHLASNTQQDDYIDFRKVNAFLDEARATGNVLLPPEWKERWPGLVPLIVFVTPEA